MRSSLATLGVDEGRGQAAIRSNRQPSAPSRIHASSIEAAASGATLFAPPAGMPLSTTRNRLEKPFLQGFSAENLPKAIAIYPEFVYYINVAQNHNADVAQPVEHILGKDEVTSSILVISSNVKPLSRKGLGVFVCYSNIIVILPLTADLTATQIIDGVQTLFFCSSNINLRNKGQKGQKSKNLYYTTKTRGS